MNMNEMNEMNKRNGTIKIEKNENRKCELK
jgi:hypothetical protein